MQLPVLVALGVVMAAPAESDQAEDPSHWSGVIGIGLVWLTGNSDLLGLTGTTVIEYDGEKFAATIEADGAYEKATAEGGTDREVVAASVDGFARGEYRFTPTWSLYALAGGEVDRVASLAGRIDAELGIGLTLLEREMEDVNEVFFRVYLGGHFSRDFRTQYYPEPLELEDVDAWGPGAGLTFRYELIPNVELDEYASVVVNLFHEVRTIVESTTALTIWITSHLAVAVFFSLDLDTDAPPDTKATDTSLTVGFEVDL